MCLCVYVCAYMCVFGHSSACAIVSMFVFVLERV